jgi:hypothetical protein
MCDNYEDLEPQTFVASMDEFGGVSIEVNIVHDGIK